MKVLIFGAGPLGSLYTHLLQDSGADVSILARGDRYNWIRANGLSLVDEICEKEESSQVRVVDTLTPEADYDLVIVFVRKNKLRPVFKSLAACENVKNILFMGNNASGFDEYLQHLPAEKLLFGFPNAGGGIKDQIVHYADREKPSAKRRDLIIGEIDGQYRERTVAIESLFENAGIPVHISTDIDGWLKYHVALVSPFVGALYRHDCDNYRAARDKELIRTLIRAAKEGRDVLRQLGYEQQPIEFKLMSWLPEFMSVIALRGMLGSKFAAVAFAMHAEAARDEMQELAREFESLVSRTSVKTPNIDWLRMYSGDGG